jgi:hypothetical protein
MKYIYIYIFRFLKTFYGIDGVPDIYILYTDILQHTVLKKSACLPQ